MMRMGLPQHGQGCSGAFGSSGFVVAALMASIGMSGTASSSRIRAMLLARVGLVEQAIVTDAVEALFKWKNCLEGRERYGVMTLDTHEFIRRLLMHVLPQCRPCH
jgi:hypothetical protein